MKSILVTSSLLILLIAALRPLLRGRINPRVQYALWLIAALRLLVPVELAASSFSAMSLLNRAEEHTHLAESIGRTSVPIAPVPSYDEAYLLAVREYDSTLNQYVILDDWYIADFTPEEQAMLSARARELQAKGPTLAQLAEQYAKPVWLGGAAVMGAWFLLVNLRLRRKLRAALPVEADCPLPVYVTPELPSPCLCGVFRPAVYVTPAALASQDRMRHVLAHELTHYRHRDHWWAWVRCLCLCLYWFDPLVWWAAALSRQDCELACDEGAIRRLGEPERIPYGRTLVAMIAAGRNSLLQTATTMTGGKRRVQERIKLIARKPKTVMAAALALALIVGCAVGCTFTGAPEDVSEPTPSTQPDAAPLDAPRLPLSTLRERLLDVPEELRPTVAASASETKAGINDIALVTYWWEVPAEWESEQSPWLLDVHRWERTGIEARGWPETSDDCIRDLIAQDEKFYYVMERPVDTRFQMEDSGPFTAAYQAIRAFAEKTVLETQGVERYPDQPLDTLQERLETIPASLLGTVVFLPREQAVDTDFLVSYWMDRDWAKLDDTGLGWLLTVEQWDQVRFENYLYSIDTGTYWVFARDSNYYYAFIRPTDARYEWEDAEYYSAAFRDIWRYAEQQVVGTKGVEPFDAEELRSRDYLWEGKTYTDVAYWPYKAINGNTDIVWIYRLVQLATDGPGGVWIPERWQVIDEEHGVDPTPRHIKPDTGGRTVAEYAKQLQAEADAGNADWATDPIEALRRFEAETGGRTDIPLDSFTRDGGYIQEVLAGRQPTEEQKAIQAAMDVVIATSGIELTLAPAGSSRVYAYSIPSLEEWEGSQGYEAYRLGRLPTDFAWEYLGETIRDFPQGDTLVIQTPDRTRIQVWDGSNIMGIQRTSGDTAYYEAQNLRESDAPLGTFFLNPSPYQYLRSWFDHVELTALRTTCVPDRGQSHEDVAKEWIEGFEGAYLKCAPGSTHACTYVRAENVKADCHSFMTKEDMDEFARSRGRTGDGYGKTWFSFTYDLVFVPENENAKEYLLAGNTEDYTGGDAPEGAQIYMRVAYMDLTDEGWVCRGTGTGW